MRHAGLDRAAKSQHALSQSVAELDVMCPDGGSGFIIGQAWHLDILLLAAAPAQASRGGRGEVPENLGQDDRLVVLGVTRPVDEGQRKQVL